MKLATKIISGSDILDELKNIGFDPCYIKEGANKHKFLNIKIFDVTPVQATIIKQTALSVGCDCAVHRGVLDQSIPNSNCILSGSISQINNVAKKLSCQPFSLSELSKNLEKKINTEEKSSPKIMGILNLSEDSFSNDYKDPVERSKELINEGADIIDIGAQSTRPGADFVDCKTQIEKIMPILDFLKNKGVILSVDTTSSLVAKEAIKGGADIINDVSFLNYDDKLLETVIKNDKKLILTHSKGTPKTMNRLAKYGNVTDNVYLEIAKKTKYIISEGLKPNNLIIDAGFGFAKDVAQNLELMKHIEEFKSLGFMLLAGTSRKRVIQSFSETRENDELDFITSLSSFYFALKNVDIMRVHNVKITKQAINFALEIR